MTQPLIEQITALKQAIAAQEGLRPTLGDRVVDATLAVLQEQLAKLEAQVAPSERQRKQVTVLFADVSGFTAMSETMDAEDVQETMNALWQRVDKEILDHNGRIDKHIGDAVMALWGVDEAREDDPEQAIRAALAMQTAVAEFSAENDVPLKMRIGLNTGPVLLGEVGITAEFTAMGDTVNVASRLEHAAPVGGVLIGHDTYRQVRGIFDVASLDPLRVKGKTDPLQVYLVERAKPRAFRVGTRGIEGVETQMIGRDAELKALQDAYESVVAHNQLTAMTVVGEAGVGKSRLLYEFENWLELRPEHIWYFKGRASHQQQGMPLGLIRDMLGRRFQIQDDDPLPQLQEKFTAGLTEFLPDDPQVAMKAAVLGSWVGHDFRQHPAMANLRDDPQQIHNRALLYLAQLINAAAMRQPVLLLFDDIHWTDDSSLDAALTLLRRLVPYPIFVLGIARPALYERRPDWGEDIAHHTRLDLTPLAAEASQALAEELLQRIDPLPPMLVDLVINRAEGNPFYAEELVKMLIDNGAIITREAQWQIVADKLVNVAIPSTLTGVLQARLDKLPPAEKMTLQQASVIGRLFWDEAVAAVAQKDEVPLPRLQAKEFIFPRNETAFANTTEYIFKHALLRDVTYETVLKRARRTYHGLVAEWLAAAATANGREDEYAALIGEHYDWAQENELAAHWYGRAGKQAAAAFANEDAVRYLTQALELTPENKTEAQFDLLLAREKVYDLQGERTAQQADLMQLADLAQQMDTLKQAEVALRHARYAESTSQYALAITQAQQAIQLAQEVGDKGLMAEGHGWWGIGLSHQGEYAPAQAQFQQGLHLAREVGNKVQEASSLNGLGIVTYYLGEYAQAQAYYEQALTIRQKIGYQWSIASSLNNLGIVANHLGERVQAQAYYEQALAIQQEIGDQWGIASSLNNLGVVANHLGEYAQEQAYYEQALAIQQEIGNQLGIANSLNNLGLVARNLGEYAQAQMYYEQSLVIRHEIGDRRGKALVYSNLAFVYHLQEQQTLAHQYSQQALEMAREVGSPYVLGYALTHLGHTLLALAQLDEAQTAYQEAYTLRHEAGQMEIAMEPLAGLARVALAQEDMETAVNHAHTIHVYLNQQALGGRVLKPMRVYLTCYQVLAAAADERAPALLATAYKLVTQRAAKLPEEKRATYWAKPAEAGIRAAWQEEK